MLKRLLAVLLLSSPAGWAAPAASATPPGHIIRPGDTLSGIADRYHVTVGELRRWNNLAAKATLRPDGAVRLSASYQVRPRWSTRVEPVTAAEVNGDPAKRCPVPASELRRVWVRYMDFDGIVHDGNLIVHESIAPATQRAFALLYEWRFPIAVMQPASVNLPGSTDRSIVTSGYECRTVAGTTKWSQHAYGLAIDVNPRQNPMIRGDYLDPPHSEPWIPRGPYRTGMIHEAGAAAAFTANGFAWGGRWHSLKDYMHFSPTNL
ncbi:M15 family metallopeptidase [Actinoplanes siamensis]|uniref:LysM domain-containing protein n=1 Tax=Actinoplanes siamensis TaxID=1223317 RepID=A0A919N4K0_9ACTN|nr:M15 family metallopeptidase [Actinoplanes siamensis]GIF04294.1 hypothetical protein Asi03nite_18320 [Actinoplanes siamensis]